jgi:hypothetical protein
MRKTRFASFLAVSALATSAHATLVNFSYTQSDATTGSGSIAPFTLLGHNFTATPLPSATVFNPNIGTPAGFVGTIDAQSLGSDEPNEAVGLLFNGSVTATATDGSTIQIPLKFVPAQLQTPTNTNDYTWTVLYGDSPANGDDAVSSALRFAFYLGRDTVIDATDTPNTFQRYTQDNKTFLTGVQDVFTNTDTTTAPIKDAMDAGDPQGTDAVGLPLAFYFGYRDTGAITSGTILVDSFAVGGLLNADDTTLVVVPEPSSALLVLTGSALLLRRRRR